MDRVYFHNFSYFDGIFILRILSTMEEIKRPIIRDNRLIQIPFKFDKTGMIYFHDSYLLLPESLDKLGKSFKVDNKGIFPIFFLNEPNLDWEYSGKLPEYKYFHNLSHPEYLQYKLKYLNKNLNLKEELVKYCEQDVVTLYQVINQFSKEIFKVFKVDIIKYPTLSSVAFAIYRTNYMSSEIIPLVEGEI